MLAQMPPVATTAQMLATGLDVGNSSVKLAIHTDEIRIPSYFQPLAGHLADIPTTGHVRYQEGDRTDLVNQSWLGGISAYQKNPLSVLRVTDDVHGKPRYALQLLLAALTELPHFDQLHVAVCASIHDCEAMGGDLASALNGRHLVKLGNYPVTEINIRTIKTFEEGMGAVAQHRGELNLDSTTVLFDLGNGTTAVSLLGAKGKLLERRVFVGGVERLIDAIARNVGVRKVLAREGDRHLIREAIESQIFQYGNQKLDLNPIYRTELKPWLMQTLAPVTKFAEPWMASAASILAIGGGSMLPLVGQLLATKGIAIAPDGVWSNARGLRKIAEILMQRGI